MTREEAIKKLESLKISLPAAKDEISGIIKLIESPWISAKEGLPCNHEELICSGDKNLTLFVIALVHSFVVLSRMEKFEGKWHWTTDEPSHWFAIPELPK